MKLSESALWRMEKNGVTQSFLQSFLNCRMQCYLTFVKGWQPKKLSIGMRFGNCFHYVLEQAYSRDFLPVKQLVKEYEDEFERPDKDDELIFGLVEKMAPIYFAYHKDIEKEWIWAEKRLDSSYTMAYKGKQIEIPLHGLIDGAFISNPGEKVWIMDHKCLSRIDHNFEETLQFNIQILMYMYLGLLELGKHPSGFILNVIRRPQDKQGKKTLKEYLDHVTTKVIADPPYYFRRFKLIFEPKEIFNWAENWLEPLIHTIYHWERCNFEPRWVNPDQLIGKYGKSFFFDAIVNNDYSNLYRRQVAFPELVSTNGQ